MGFRPFVYRLATQHRLTGWVRNTASGVEITVSGPQEALLQFRSRLVDLAPSQAQILQFSHTEKTFASFPDFAILPSEPEGEKQVWLTPDFAMCDNCRKELHQPENRRYHYPFLTCTDCGPRFSVIRQLPYDRDKTAMATFAMCPTCLQEYQDPSDRRFHSQTNSCPTCGITLWMAASAGSSTPPEGIIQEAVYAISRGEILAVKGIGGFLLMCDARQEQTIRTLRARKHRPTKPLAVMYPDLDRISEDLLLNDAATEALQSVAAPIVLLPLQDHPESGICAEALAPGLEQLGVMLPYAPLLELLATEAGFPLVATSANISGSPILADHTEALSHLAGIADKWLLHDRDIVVPQDDSVMGFAPLSGQSVVYRRARGMAPGFFSSTAAPRDLRLLAMGADMKNTVAWTHQGHTYISQYLGDLAHVACQQRQQAFLDQVAETFDFLPQTLLTDAHPAYHATQAGQQKGADMGVPVTAYYHHQAHFAALLAEHDLLAEKRPILGFVWDGTGWGEDGNIWGGECLVYEEGQFTRTHHLAYAPMRLGDKMAREPRVSALAFSEDLMQVAFRVQGLFDARAWQWYQQLWQRPAPIYTSSMGRLFDAVAALLHLCPVQSYEGEAAMRLEALATRHIRQHGTPQSAYPLMLDKAIDWKPWIAGILEDLDQGQSPGFVAARFHLTLVEGVAQLAETMAIRDLAFSGGVFQNRLLIDLICQRMAATHTLWFHRQLSPNDENISLGQLACYQIDHVLYPLKKQAHVPGYSR